MYAPLTQLISQIAVMSVDPPARESDMNLPANLKTESPISVSLFIAPPTTYTLRANSIPTYLLLNRHLALSALDPRKHPSSKAGPKTSVGQDSLVAENCTLGERVRIRKSIVGAGVSIGTKSTIQGSVIMDGVVLGENVSLEGCVVCRGAKVGGEVKLVDCMVAAGYVVEEGLKLSKQNLVELDELNDEEIQEDEDDK
jgi:translation initiation factor eIF-2B subunit gamma